MKLRRPYVHLTLVDPGFSLRPLRISATSALKFVNGENAEIRRGPQRKAVDLEELTPSAFISIKDPNEKGT
ncbi:MAG TPA: hypothetical protein VM656_04990 [Pyrinomonadaceae bacterium]|nr:hypothetical protein [Pyrinomonadaceae bacterium]